MTPPNPSCPFCHLPPERVLLSNAVGWVIRDAFPVSPGHTLVIPKRNVRSFFDLDDFERNGLMALLTEAQAGLPNELGPAGYNVGIHDGPAAGQTVPHCTFTALRVTYQTITLLEGLRRAQSHGRYAPHKPLLVLLALDTYFPPTLTLQRWWGWTCSPRARCARQRCARLRCGWEAHTQRAVPGAGTVHRCCVCGFDLRIVFSRHAIAGSKGLSSELKHHGQPLLRPQSPDLLPGPEFIAWNQHNVFKTPARA